jgi:hypothetical protein
LPEPVGVCAESTKADLETCSAPPAAELSNQAEDIRPFTDYIEEFRQAEAARLQTALHESQGEAFPLLSPEETATPPAVSPLLRPATRFRAPRHGNGSYYRKEMAAIPETPAPVETAEQPAQETNTNTNAEQPVAESVSPKPARRYRFDRPNRSAAFNGANGATPALSNKPLVVPPPLEVLTTGDAATSGKPATDDTGQSGYSQSLPAKMGLSQSLTSLGSIRTRDSPPASRQ